MLLSIPLLVVKMEGPGKLLTAFAATLFGLSFITVTMTLMMYADRGFIIKQEDAHVHFRKKLFRPRETGHGNVLRGV